MITTQIYLRPKTIDDALGLAKRHSDDFSYLAGGTDLLVNRYNGNNLSNCLIDISGISELQKVAIDDHSLKIGSLVKLDHLKNFPAIRENFPVLLEAAQAVGSPMVRKIGTIGGNILCENRCIYYNQSIFGREAINFCLKSGGDICIATGGVKACFSEFVSDTAPALISLDARVEVVDIDGINICKLEDIYSGDGVRPRNISKTAIIKAILLPSGREFRSVFKKLSPRNSVDFTSLTIAVSMNKNGRLKIVLGGVSPKPLVLEATIHDDLTNIIKESLKQSKTVDNDVYSRLYRRKMIAVFLQKSFEELRTG
jgi:4-hydroxybenzoyl-CoA reductase beta subunit